MIVQGERVYYYNGDDATYTRGFSVRSNIFLLVINNRRPCPFIRTLHEAFGLGNKQKYVIPGTIHKSVLTFPFYLNFSLFFFINLLDVVSVRSNTYGDCGGGGGKFNKVHFLLIYNILSLGINISIKSFITIIHSLHFNIKANAHSRQLDLI
jgi:hypothetical protein